MAQKNSKKSSQTSYLEWISFDPRLTTSFVAKYITNIRVIILLVISIALLGFVSYIDLPKRLNPEIKIPIVSVVTLLPGASPEDIESLITIPIENELASAEGLDTMTSVSRDNVSVISMQFFSSVTPEKAKNDIQSAVDSLTTLPNDAQTPKVTALDFEDQPVWSFAVSTNSDIASLISFSNSLKKSISDLPKVDRVTLSGIEEEEIVVTISPEKIAQFGINPLTLSSVVRSSLVAYPAGTVVTQKSSYALSIDQSILTVEDIRNLRLSVGPTVVKLGDIATVARRSKPDQIPAYYADANTSATRIVTFHVYKSSSANIDAAVSDVKKVVDTTLNQYNGRFSIKTIINTGEEIDKQFVELLGEFRSTIILVFTCLFIFLGLRQALIASFTVPLTFLSAFVFMGIVGMSINFLSLFAFLLALGLLIDDTIVVVSAMTTYYKTGKFSPFETGLLVWRDTIIPIWSTTITTIWSFVPLLITSGIIGEFIKPIPIVVTVTMLSSTAIAVGITLPIMIVLLKPNIAKRVQVFAIMLGVIIGAVLLWNLTTGNAFRFVILVTYAFILVVFRRNYRTIISASKTHLAKSKVFTLFARKLQQYSERGVINIDGLSQAYHRLILRILKNPTSRHKVVIAIIAYAVFSFMLLPLGLVQNEFFPKTDSEELYINLEMPSGTNLITTEAKSREILDKIRKTPYSDFVVNEIGSSFSNSFTGGSGGSNVSLFTLHLPPEEERPVKSYDIAEKIRKTLATETQGKISVAEQSSGPPAGADLQIKLLGPDLGVLNEYAQKISQYLSTQKGVANVDISIKPGTSKLVFVPDREKVEAQGFTIDSLGIWLRMFASGFTLGDINFDKRYSDKTDITFRFSSDDKTPEQIASIVIPTKSGNVPLLSLGSIKTEQNPTIITRENGKRTMSVSASVLPGYQIAAKNKELEEFADSLKLPLGYEWQTGGVNEENAKSVQSILQAMIVSFVLIMITMVLQFQSYRQAAIVLLVIPLAVSSVFLIFALTGTPLSFPALIGVLSLFGIVVTNSMFIVDKINLNKAEGMPFEEAIADAGASRLEPIILTKLCTVLGLLSVTLSNPLWRGLGGAIISGILLASTIMLLFIPAVYYEIFKSQDMK